MGHIQDNSSDSSVESEVSMAIVIKYQASNLKFITVHGGGSEVELAIRPKYHRELTSKREEGSEERANCWQILRGIVVDYDRPTFKSVSARYYICQDYSKIQIDKLYCSNWFITRIISDGHIYFSISWNKLFNYCFSDFTSGDLTRI